MSIKHTRCIAMLSRFDWFVLALRVRVVLHATDVSGKGPLLCHLSPPNQPPCFFLFLLLTR